MNLSAIRDRLIREEGRRATMYLDTARIPTIGVGFNLQRSDAPRLLARVGADFGAVMDGAALSPAQIDALLDEALRESAQQAQCLVARFGELPAVAQEVLVDLTYNMGPVRVSKFVRMLAAIDRRDWESAANELRDSLWYRQVKSRGPALVEMLRSAAEA